jgi:hypothetical protein
MQEDKQKEAQQLLNALDPMRLSKEDFVNAFQKVLELVLAIQKQQAQAVANLEQTYANLFDKMHADHSSHFQELKGQVNDVFVGDKLKRMHGETRAKFKNLHDSIHSVIDGKIKEVDARMSKVKDGERGLIGPRGLSGRDAIFDNKILDGIKKDIETIKKLPRGRLGMKAIRSVRTVDLTSSVDGATTAFTLPQDTISVLGVWSTQFPVTFRQDVDWTFTGRTLTLVVNQVGTPQTGQTLFCLIEALFHV